MRTTVGLIGPRGYVGSQILSIASGMKKFKLITLDREEAKDKLLKCDVIIHAANSGKRFFAKKNPDVDFNETVHKTEHILAAFPNKKIVLLSSLSARTQPEHPYGKHRKMAEDLVLGVTGNLVVRMGPMYGGAKQGGAFYDIVNDRPVYVSADTLYGLTPIQYNARKILTLLDKTGLVEIGAHEGIRLGDLAVQINSKSSFQGEDDTQVPRNSFEDAPLVEEAIAYGLEARRRVA